jgi:hypothetical protein
VSLANRLRPILDAEFAEDVAIVTLYRVQRDKEPSANLAIRESLGNEL